MHLIYYVITYVNEMDLNKTLNYGNRFESQKQWLLLFFLSGRFLLSFFHRFPGSSRSSPSVIFDEAREEKEPEGGSRVSFNRNLI